MTAFIKQILYALVGIVAGMMSWVVVESVLSIQTHIPMYFLVASIHGLALGAVFGVLLGTVEGIAVSSRYKVLQGGGMGLLIGSVAGFSSFLFIQASIHFLISAEFMTLDAARRNLVPIVRLIGFLLLGAALGSIEGLRSKSGRKTGFGVLGGLCGGLLGGLVLMFNLFENPAWNRFTSFLLLGLGIGGFYSLLERKNSFGKVKVLNGPLKFKEYLLVKRVSTVGTSRDCDICLAGYEGVGFHHGSIEWRKGELFLIPAESGALTVVNELPTIEDPLRYEDVIQLGSAKLFFLP